MTTSIVKKFLDEKSILDKVLSDLSQEQLKDLGFVSLQGTVMKITVTDDVLESTDSGPIDSAFIIAKRMDDLQKIIKKTIEDDYGGIIVKVLPSSWICFFSDKSLDKTSPPSSCPQHSLVRALEAASTLQSQMTLSFTRKAHIWLAYGTVYKRTVLVQKKRLLDFHGEPMDIVQTCRNCICIPTKDSSITILYRGNVKRDSRLEKVVLGVCKDKSKKRRHHIGDDGGENGQVCCWEK